MTSCRFGGAFACCVCLFAVVVKNFTVGVRPPPPRGPQQINPGTKRHTDECAEATLRMGRVLQLLLLSAVQVTDSQGIFEQYAAFNPFGAAEPAHANDEALDERDKAQIENSCEEPSVTVQA